MLKAGAHEITACNSFHLYSPTCSTDFHPHFSRQELMKLHIGFRDHPRVQGQLRVGFRDHPLSYNSQFPFFFSRAGVSLSRCTPNPQYFQGLDHIHIPHRLPFKLIDCIITAEQDKILARIERGGNTRSRVQLQMPLLGVPTKLYYLKTAH